LVLGIALLCVALILNWSLLDILFVYWLETVLFSIASFLKVTYFAIVGAPIVMDAKPGEKTRALLAAGLINIPIMLIAVSWLFLLPLAFALLSFKSMILLVSNTIGQGISPYLMAEGFNPKPILDAITQRIDLSSILFAVVFMVSSIRGAVKNKTHLLNADIIVCFWAPAAEKLITLWIAILASNFLWAYAGIWSILPVIIFKAAADATAEEDTIYFGRIAGLLPQKLKAR
jgi:hypothetical protein